jgi:post-segregation antitoxin (ccd killing protein)
MIHKAITITKEQEKWIKDNCINLSRLVQKSIEREMVKK